MCKIELYRGDCLELMKNIPDKSVDMILCDLPYGTTQCKWDKVIPFEPLWEQYKRIIKDNGAIVLFGSEPFSSYLRMSNIKDYKYDWVWEKSMASNFALCKKQPQKKHENIIVFYNKQSTYNPQMEKGKPYIDNRKNSVRKASIGASEIKRQIINNNGSRYPSSVQKFKNGNNNRLHPTQKPVELLEYLIKTYTNEGETVLDNCAGSMSTGIAAINTNRNCILIEKDANYFKIGKNRIFEHIQSETPKVEVDVYA